MRVLADESVFDPRIEALRLAGHEGTSAHAVGLRGKPDDRVYRAAIRGRFVLLTLDKDFTRMSRFNPRRCAAIIVGRRFKLPVRTATRILVEAIGALSESAIRGKLVIITRAGARIRTPRG